jgi:hypothetical protein
MVDWDVLPPQRRAIIRQAVGAQSLATLVSPYEHVEPDEGELPQGVPLPEDRVIEDVKHEWLTKPVVDLLRSLEKLAIVDPLDDAQVGQLLRNRVRRVLLRMEPVRELVAFLGNFESEVVALLRDAAIDALGASYFLIVALTADDDLAASDAHEDLAHFQERVTEAQVIFEGLPRGNAEEMGIEALSATDLSALVLGERLPHANWRDNVDALAQSGRFFDVGGRQFRHILPTPGPELNGPNFVSLALRMGTNVFPLLAHRALYLTWNLLRRSEATNDVATRDLVAEFLRDESGWIMASSEPYENALRDYLEKDDRLAILEALRALSEGVLRPYGSLLVALHAIASGAQRMSPPIAPALGDLSQRFAPVKEPSVKLLESFVRADMRNAIAHQRAAVGGGGELIIRNEDGTLTTLIPNHVFGTTAGLRSALDGVDVAVSLYFGHAVTPHLDPRTFRARFMSTQTIHFMANVAATEHTRGVITAVDARDGVLTLTYEGEDGGEWELMLRHLGAVFEPGTFPTLRLVRSDGTPIGTLREQG